MDTSTLSHFHAVAEAQARAGQPQATYAALADALQALVGHKVMTVLRMDAATLRSVRLFSSEPSYPPGGTKQHRRGRWSEAIFDRRTFFLAPRRDDVRATFPDYQGIEAAGCASIVCLPVRYDGQVLATLNLWHVDGHYDEAAARRALPFASFLVPACRA